MDFKIEAVLLSAGDAEGMNNLDDAVRHMLELRPFTVSHWHVEIIKESAFLSWFDQHRICAMAQWNEVKDLHVRVPTAELMFEFDKLLIALKLPLHRILPHQTLFETPWGQRVVKYKTWQKVSDLLDPY